MNQTSTGKSFLIDINHPSQVHVFKYLYWHLIQNHRVLVTVKKIPSAIELLKLYDIPYTLLGNMSDSIAGKIGRQFAYDLQVRRLVKEHRIDYGVGTSFTINHVSKISKMVSFFLDDDDSAVQPFTKYFANPFADFIITPHCLAFENYGKKHITYPGYHELAYLHPNRFQPDPDILKELGVKENDPYFVLRFNAFKAHHDIGVSGMPQVLKRELIKRLSKQGRVFITHEREIDPEFQAYQLQIAQDKIHSLLYYSTMFLGDSQTMTSEAAVLGVAAIRCNTLVGKIAYLEEQEKKYQLTFGFLPSQADKMLDKIDELLNTSNLKQEWQKRRRQMLTETIDVTSFLIWFFEGFPHSLAQIRQNKNIWQQFNNLPGDIK
jgi:predicted glycosyltransferase